MGKEINGATEHFKKMMEDFMAGAYEPLDFSYDLPSDTIDFADELREHDPELLSILNDELPEICAEYERGMDPQPFIDAVCKEYERAFPE